MKFNFKSHGGGGRLVPSRNKGSFSLELIAIVVCVILVSVLALRTFGGQISNTTNETTNTVKTLTSNILNGSDGSGGPGSGGSSVNITNGQIITLTNLNLDAIDADNDGVEDTFRVLDVTNGTVKLLSMSSPTVRFNTGSAINDYKNYQGSNLETELNNIYESFTANNKSALVLENVSQEGYSFITSSTIDTYDFRITDRNKVLIKSGSSNNLGSLAIRPVLVEDIVAYLGKEATKADLVEMFWGDKGIQSESDSELDIIWLGNGFADSMMPSMLRLFRYGDIANFSMPHYDEVRYIITVQYE